MRRQVWIATLLSACGASAATPECPPAAARNINEPTTRQEATVSEMTLERLDTIVRQQTTDVRSDGRVWEMTYQGVQLALVTDSGHDRMRIVRPVVAEADMTREQRSAVMEANFHSALDARYATSGGVLYATFIHPLSSLSERDLVSAVQQVATLAATFGTHYSSGVLVFGGGEPVH